MNDALANRPRLEKPPSPFIGVLMGTGVIVALYCSSFASYMLFHALVEVTTIAIALALFILTWHTRRFLSSGSLLVLGIGYGLIAVIDLIHVLAYKGMGLFPAYGANLPTQLWIAARFLQAVLLCAAPLFARRGINGYVLFGICLAAVSATTVLIFSGLFPDCFIEGKGLTPFKIISEYVISALLVVALSLFIGKRSAFSPGIFTLIFISILCTIGSELAFTSYLSVYGPANMVGHFLKLAAFYLLYRALVVPGLQSPFELIFRDLKQAENALTAQREFNRCLLDSMADGVVACDAAGTLTLFNRTAREWHGMDPMQLPAEEWARHYDLFRADGVTPLPTEEVPLAMAFRGKAVTDAGMAIVATGQPTRFILANGSEITDAEGDKLGAVVVMRDITAFRQLEQELREVNQDLEERVAERTAALRASEEKYRTLIQKVHAAVVVYGADSRVKTSNEQAQRLLGLTEEQLAGKEAMAPDWLFLREDGSALPPAEHPVNRLLATGEPLRNAVLGVRRPGTDEDIWILVSADPVRDQQGAVAQVIVTFVDITRRKEAEEALHRLNRELRAISNCNQTLMKAEDEQTLLNDICRIICDEAGYSMAWVGYAEHDPEKTIRPVAWAGSGSNYIAETRLSWSEELERGQGPAGLAIRNGKAVHVEDFATDSRMVPWRDAALAHGYRSGLALPLKDEKATVFGVLLIYSAEAYTVTAEEFKLLEELAGDLAFGVTVLRTRTELKRAEKVAQARFRMLERAYTAGITMDDTLRAMLDEIEAQTESRVGFYHFLEEDQQTISLQAWSTNTLTTGCAAECKARHYPVATAGVWADCLREQRPVIHNDYASLPNRKEMPAGHAALVRELVVPVFRGPRIVALIGVGNKPTDYNDTDVQIASFLGDFSWEIVIRKQAEEDLRQSEARLTEAQRIAHLGNWELDLATSTLLCSDEIYRMFELDREQSGVSYGAFLESIHPDDKEMVDHAYKQSMANHAPFGIVHRLLLRDGRIRYVEERGETFYDEDGRPLRSVGTTHDVTERKLAEEEVRALNQQLERRVAERTAELEAKNDELERMNQLFVGRELRMIELKERIKELEAQEHEAKKL